MSQLVFPSNEFANVDSGALDVMTTAGGKFLEIFFTAAYVAGALGSAITSQASVARILYAMGRDGILSRRVFGHISAAIHHPDLRDPGGVGDVAGCDLDRSGRPGLHRQFRCTGGFSAVNLTVIKHYFVDEGDRGAGGFVNNLVLPLIGFALDRLAVDKPVRFRAGGRIVLAYRGFLWLLWVTRGFQRPTPVLQVEE